MYLKNNGNFIEAIIMWDTKPSLNQEADVLFFMHDYEKRAKYYYGFKTLEIDLNKSVDELILQSKKSMRSILRQSLPQELEQKSIYEPSNDDINVFVKLFNEFAEYKKISKIDESLLLQMASDKKLVISFLKSGQRILIGHSHYHDGERTRLLYSFQTPELFNSEHKNKANTFLTWFDIIDAKEKGFKIYDFGGIGNVEGDNSQFDGIIKFKKSFGGTEKILWKGVTPIGKKGEDIVKKHWKIATSKD